MPKNATPINLTDEETCYLESLVNKGTIEARVYRRAKILLLKSAGMSNEAIAEKLDTTVPTVRLCLKKYADSGVKSALADAAGRGRRHEIFEDSKAWVINIACQKPTAFGLSAELWNPTSLTRYINSAAVEQGYPRMATASESSIRKILNEARLNPHKITYYCEKRDLDFDKKMHDLLVIYKQVVYNALGSYPQPHDIPLEEYTRVHSPVPSLDVLGKRQVVVHCEMQIQEVLVLSFIYPFFLEPMRWCFRVTIEPKLGTFD